MRPACAMDFASALAVILLTLASRRLTYFGASADALARAGRPFAVCMGLGAAAYQLWGTPWS